MKISTQRAIDRWVGQILCAVVSLWARLMRLSGAHLDAPSNATPRILIILLSEMGSVVLAKAMFDTIKARHPQAELHVLQLKKNQSVMRLMGFVPEENLHAINDASLLSLIGDLWRTCRDLRSMRLDGVIDCELFSRISALLSYACGARVRVGFTPHTQEGLYRGSFINAAVPYNTYQHISLQFVGLAKVLLESLPLSAAQLAERSLRDMGYRVRRNDPYAGGFITRHYGRPRAGLHALQIELNRALYMDEERIQPAAGFDAVRADLTRLMAILVAQTSAILMPGLDAQAAE